MFGEYGQQYYFLTHLQVQEKRYCIKLYCKGKSTKGNIKSNEIKAKQYYTSEGNKITTKTQILAGLSVGMCPSISEGNYLKLCDGNLNTEILKNN